MAVSKAFSEASLKSSRTRIFFILVFIIALCFNNFTISLSHTMYSDGIKKKLRRN
jgi:hypothetical protein